MLYIEASYQYEPSGSGLLSAQGLKIERANHVWAADITYIPMRGICLSGCDNGLGNKACTLLASVKQFKHISVLRAEEAFGLRYAEIFNTDQGSQFTSVEFTELLKERVLPLAWTEAHATMCS